MMQGLKDILDSRKGVFVFAVLVCATVLVGLERMTVSMWADLVVYLCGIYVGGNVLQAVGQSWATRSLPPVPPTAPTPPAG